MSGESKPNILQPWKPRMIFERNPGSFGSYLQEFVSGQVSSPISSPEHEKQIGKEKEKMDSAMKSDSASADHRAEIDSLPPLEYDESSFNRILTLERKRTERSKRPFVLMLLSIDRVPADENGADNSGTIVSCLASSIRDIDVLGWYKAGSVIGVIFTEIGDCKPALDCILNRVRTNLLDCLDSDIVKRIDISIHYFPEISGRSAGDLTLYPDIKKTRSARKISLFVKRSIDIVGSLSALILCLPVFIVIAALIKHTSKGPVFFRQKRVGQYGKTFTFLKFRSMFVNNDPTIHKEYVKSLICSSDSAASGSCDSQTQQVYKIQNDPRVTPLGRFIRRTSLDELPQFINVLKGDMSLVGPRPPIPYEVESYELWHRRRVLEMKPGITGLWQVEGRSRTTFNEMVRLDLFYLANWSVWLDLKLLFRTPFAVFTSKGAY